MGRLTLSRTTDGNAGATARVDRTALLRDGPIVSTLLRLAGPNVLNLIAITFIITFDGVLVGALGRDPLAGAALVFPFVMLMQHMAAGGIGGGVSSAIARALGGTRTKEAEALAVHAVIIAVAMATVSGAIMLFWGPAIYARMGGRETILEEANKYSLVIFSGSLAPWLFNTLANVIRGTGEMMLPAAIILGCAALHLVLSPALVFGWGPLPPLGIMGAATGFVTAFAVGALACVGVLRSRHVPIRLAWPRERLRVLLFWEILRVGLPGALNTLLTNLGVVLITALFARIGPHALAGYGVGARLEYVLIPVAFGFGTALVAMVGVSVGSGQIGRAERVGWYGAALVGGIAGAVGLTVAVWPGAWLFLFNVDATARKVATTYLQIVGPSYALFGAGLALHFASQGAGRVVWPVVANATRVIGAAVCGWAMITFGAGVSGLCVAVAAGFIAYGTAVLLAVRAGAWRTAVKPLQ